MFVRDRLAVEPFSDKYSTERFPKITQQLLVDLGWHSEGLTSDFPCNHRLSWVLLGSTMLPLSQLHHSPILFFAVVSLWLDFPFSSFLGFPSHSVSAFTIYFPMTSDWEFKPVWLPYERHGFHCRRQQCWACIPCPLSPSSPHSSSFLVGLRIKKQTGWIASLVAAGRRAGSLV